jgi:hypothetical protein
MGIVDIVLFPFYVLLFYLFFAARRKKITDPILKRYHLHGFWIKIFSCIAFTLFNYYVYIGDSLVLYYDEGVHLQKLILKDITQIKWLFTAGINFDQNLLFNTLNRGYFVSESNFFIAKLVTVFSFFSFGSYSIINLVFSLISFSGVWRLFKFFYELYPHLHKKLAIAIIYLPTFIFWSSGILKDPICTAMIGFLTYAMYSMVVKKESIIKNSLVIMLSGYTLGLVKSYILVSYVPFLVLFILLLKLKMLQKVSSKIFLLLSLAVLGLIGFLVVADRLQEEMGSLAFDKISESVQQTQSNFINMADLAESSFSLGVDFDGSPGSLVKMAPAAINATLFRPYIWESKKISTLLSSLESLALMLLTLYVLVKAGITTFIGSILKSPAIMYCFLFSILFAVFVGATTLNFGTLVRYKIPCMPFYIIAMVLILERKKALIIKAAEKKEKKLLEAALKNTVTH